VKAVREFGRYIEANQNFIPNYGGSVPAWGDDFHGLRGVDGQPRGEQAHGEEAADALDQTRCADVAPCALCATQRRVEQIQRVVALRIIAGGGRGGMNPQVLSSPDLSTVRHEVSNVFCL
jgi:hypothetical protein